MLETIIMDCNMSINFYSLLCELLDYNANIIPKEDFNEDEEYEEYKIFIPKKDIMIQFREDNNDPDFSVAVYCKTDKEWEYLDNITFSAYDNGMGFIESKIKESKIKE